MGKVKGKSGPLARRPDNSAFKQQRLPAWTPMLTAHTVLPSFYLMSLICMLLGVWLLLTVQTTKEIKVSDCVLENSTCFFAVFFFFFLHTVCGDNVGKYTKRMCVKDRKILNALVCNKTGSDKERKDPRLSLERGKQERMIHNLFYSFNELSPVSSAGLHGRRDV